MNLEPGYLYFLPTGRKYPRICRKYLNSSVNSAPSRALNLRGTFFGKKKFDNVTQTPKRQTLYSYFILIRRKSLSSLATNCDTLHDEKKLDFLLDEKTYTLPGMVQQLWWYEGERVLEDPQEL